MSSTTGNTIKHILASEMKKFDIKVPSYEEQRCISKFMISLDNLITLHQRGLIRSNLDSIANALLNQYLCFRVPVLYANMSSV